MGLWLDFRRELKKYWLFLLSSFIIIYFSFHCFCGERNIYRYFALKKEIAQAEQIAHQYAQKRMNLQRKVDHLSPLSLDTDLLDERARVILNMAADDEFIILDSDIN